MMLSLHYGDGLFSYGQNLLFVWFFLSLFLALIQICMNIFKKGEFLSLSFLLCNFFFGSIFQYHYDCFHFVRLFDSTFFRKAKKNFVFCFWFQVFANVCVCVCGWKNSTISITFSWENEMNFFPTKQSGRKTDRASTHSFKRYWFFCLFSNENSEKLLSGKFLGKFHFISYFEKKFIPQIFFSWLSCLYSLIDPGSNFVRLVLNLDFFSSKKKFNMDCFEILWHNLMAMWKHKHRSIDHCRRCLWMIFSHSLFFYFAVIEIYFFSILKFLFFSTPKTHICK